MADGAALGVERRLTGSEEGLVSVRGVVKFGEKAKAAGEVAAMRGEADQARAANKFRDLKITAAAVDFVPTERSRVIDQGATYSVGDVDYEHVGEDIVAYTMLLRPL